MQSIVDQHHPNLDAKTSSKVRFQEPGAEENCKTNEEPTNEVATQSSYFALLNLAKRQ